MDPSSGSSFSEGQELFQKVKNCFISAPVLVLQELDHQFIVEVDASDVGIWAVLFQRCPLDGELHPCAVLSRKHSSIERNYDVGNRELLAVKVALEEGRDWLEGAKQPFLVWTVCQVCVCSETELLFQSIGAAPETSQLYGMASRFDSSVMQRVGQLSQRKSFLGVNPSMFPYNCSL